MRAQLSCLSPGSLGIKQGTECGDGALKKARCCAGASAWFKPPAGISGSGRGDDVGAGPARSHRPSVVDSASGVGCLARCVLATPP